MRTYKILIVENDTNFAFVLERWLRNSLYDLTVVNCGQEGLTLVETQHWDLIITDINLPKTSGLEILAYTRENKVQSPVMLMTGYATLEMAVAAIDQDAQEFLIKPFSCETIQSKVAAALKTKRKKQNKTVLAIGAHPDDVELGCGGILLKHAENGDKVHILTMSWGGKGGNSIIRYNEAKSAAQSLGAELYMANLNDTDIQSGGDTINKIATIVKNISPDIVYTHSINDSHQDHRSVHQASIVACRDVATLECYQSPSTTIDFQPSRFVDVSDHLPEKINLVECYRSQGKREYLKRQFIESTARYWGRFANYKLVEPLEVIRSV